MKRISLLAAAVLVAAVPAAAGPASVTGEYVEARTAEVFAGGCIMSSEAETIGKQAVMAWHIDRGAFDGVALDGLNVVAAVAGDRNLGIREIGGEAPSFVKAVVYVDARASAAQRDALVGFARTMSKGLITEVAAVTAGDIAFESNAEYVTVAAGDAALAVKKGIEHKPGCGAMKWFSPFSVVTDARIGQTDEHFFRGGALGVKWSAPHRKSAFVGRFTFEPPLSN